MSASVLNLRNDNYLAPIWDIASPDNPKWKYMIPLRFDNKVILRNF
jgi:hypothetical protein